MSHVLLGGQLSVPLDTVPGGAISAAPTAWAQIPANTDSLYHAILEKTNQQLSLWWNPYGVMIGALGALFALLAIAAAVILFRQGREYKSIIDTAIARYQAILDTFIADKSREVDERLSEAVVATTQKLATATGEDRTRLEAELVEAKRAREALRHTSVSLPTRDTLLNSVSALDLGATGSWAVNPALLTTGGAGTKTGHTCAKCGYLVEDPHPTTTLVGTITCPKCGNVERRALF